MRPSDLERRLMRCGPHYLLTQRDAGSDAGTGILCGACAQGWTRELPETECRPCAEFGGTVTLVGILVSGLVFKAFVALFLAKKGSGWYRVS